MRRKYSIVRLKNGKNCRYTTVEAILQQLRELEQHSHEGLMRFMLSFGNISSYITDEQITLTHHKLFKNDIPILRKLALVYGPDEALKTTTTVGVILQASIEDIGEEERKRGESCVGDPYERVQGNLIIAT